MEIKKSVIYTAEGDRFVEWKDQNFSLEIELIDATDKSHGIDTWENSIKLHTNVVLVTRVFMPPRGFIPKTYSLLGASPVQSERTMARMIDSSNLPPCTPSRSGSPCTKTPRRQLNEVRRSARKNRDEVANL